MYDHVLISCTEQIAIEYVMGGVRLYYTSIIYTCESDPYTKSLCGPLGNIAAGIVHTDARETENPEASV